MLREERPDQVRQSVVMRRAERPERHRAVANGVRLRRSRNGRPDGVDHAPGVGLQVRPGAGRSDAARLAGEERLPDGLLQALDLLRDRGLGHAEGVGGCSERTGLERRDEALELGERQIHGRSANTGTPWGNRRKHNLPRCLART